MINGETQGGGRPPLVARRGPQSVLLCILLFFCVACSGRAIVSPDGDPEGTSTAVASATAQSDVTSTGEATKGPDVRQDGMLPGQQVWKDGASSFLFGTNDTQEWSENNIQTSPSIQQALHDAGITLVRTFFIDGISDGEIEMRIKTVENIGAKCLGVITNIHNEAYNVHLLQYLGNRCQIYEFGNEVDYGGMSIEEYLSVWNNQIPKLRKVNPNAVFIGPVTYNKTGRDDFLNRFLQGVAVSKVLPDAVSFHWYPCWKDTREGCLEKAASFADVAQEVRTKVINALGKDLPLGITEWNYDPANPPPVYGDDPEFIKQFTADALGSMVAGKVAFACQFDAASYSGYGRLDMFDVSNNQPKPQYYAMKSTIAEYKPA